MPPHADPIVRPASLDEIVDLRWAVLRQGMPRAAAVFEGDADPLSIHVVALNHQSVVGCATLHSSQWNGEPAWQLRGMAVQPDFQGRGIGRRLLEALDALLTERGETLRLWCNAREPAVAFYSQMGWRVCSERFHIETAGPHFRMSRELDETVPA